MGRPLNKKYFGNTNDSGLGGEGVASVTVTGAGTGYTDGDAVVFSAPQLAGGVTATGVVVDDPVDGTVNSISITNPGSGYTSAPTVDLTGEGNGDATATATLTTSGVNAIAFSSYVDGGSNQTDGDIVKQVAARRFKVTNSDGTGTCKLVAATPSAAGEMMISATDSSGKTYYVTKISARKATLTQYGAGGHEFTDGTSQKWSFDSAVLNDSVQLDNN